jgi:hypothetical protein
VDQSKLLDLKSVVQSDSQFIKVNDRLNRITGKLVQEVESYSENLLPFVKIYEENISQSKLDEDQIELEIFRSLIVKYQQQ